MVNVIPFLNRFSPREIEDNNRFLCNLTRAYKFIRFYSSYVGYFVFLFLEKFKGLRKKTFFLKRLIKIHATYSQVSYYSSKSFEKKHSFKILCVYLEWWTRLNVLRGSTFVDQVLAKKCLLFTVAPGILLTMSLERFHNWANAKKETLPFRIPSFPSPSPPPLPLSLSLF